jgi:hypothetical protein
MSPVGQTKTITFTFADIDGGATTPTDFTVLIWHTENSDTPLSLLSTKAKADCTATGDGIYRLKYTPALPGQYWIYCYTVEPDEDTDRAAKVASFDVDPGILAA